VPGRPKSRSLGLASFDGAVVELDGKLGRMRSDRRPVRRRETARLSSDAREARFVDADCVELGSGAGRARNRKALDPLPPSVAETIASPRSALRMRLMIGFTAHAPTRSRELLATLP